MDVLGWTILLRPGSCLPGLISCELRAFTLNDICRPFCLNTHAFYTRKSLSESSHFYQRGLLADPFLERSVAICTIVHELVTEVLLRISIYWLGRSRPGWPWQKPQREPSRKDDSKRREGHPNELSLLLKNHCWAGFMMPWSKFASLALSSPIQ